MRETDRASQNAAFPVPGLPPRPVRPPQLDDCSLTNRSVCCPPFPALPAPSRSGAGPALVDYPWRAECLHRLFVQQPLLPTAAQGQGGKGSTGRGRPHRPQLRGGPSYLNLDSSTRHPSPSGPLPRGLSLQTQALGSDKPARVSLLPLGHHPPAVKHVSPAPLREDPLCPSGHRGLPNCHQRLLLHSDVPVSVTKLGRVGEGLSIDTPLNFTASLLCGLRLSEPQFPPWWVRGVMTSSEGTRFGEGCLELA